MSSNMYEKTKTWNPFRGCEFNCSYCVPSFQRQAKRQKKNCEICYEFKPHTHPERLDRIPGSDIVFVAGCGDISFCEPEYTRRILESIRKKNVRRYDRIYYLQSKKPEYFSQFLDELPDNIILVTTLETNRDRGYSRISKAPLPTDRYSQFRALDYDRKVVTIEPILNFDLEEFSSMITSISPEYVWIGYNSKPRPVLPEPEIEKTEGLISALQDSDIPVKLKKMRKYYAPAAT